MGAGEGGLMKYLRFWLKRALKVTTKDLLRALIVRRTLRKPRLDHYRCDEGPYWAGLCRLCSQLCPCAPDWATSPLPLCPIVPGTEHQFYTELIAQQRLCVMGKIAPHPTLPKDPRSFPPPSVHLWHRSFLLLYICGHLKDDKVMNPFFFWIIWTL